MSSYAIDVCRGAGWVRVDSRKRLPDGREISVELSHDEVMDIVRQFVTSGELREELQGKLVKGGWRVVKFPDALWGKLK